jgi:hypothetical protein
VRKKLEFHDPQNDRPRDGRTADSDASKKRKEKNGQQKSIKDGEAKR